MLEKVRVKKKKESIRIERESLSVEYRERRVGVMGGCSSY